MSQQSKLRKFFNNFHKNLVSESLYTAKQTKINQFNKLILNADICDQLEKQHRGIEHRNKFLKI